MSFHAWDKMNSQLTYPPVCSPRPAQHMLTIRVITRTENSFLTDG